MIWLVVTTMLFVSLLGSGLFSGSETGLYCINRLRLHLGIQQGDPRAVRLARWLEDEQRALAVTLAGTNSMNYVFTSLVTYCFIALLGADAADAELFTVIAVTPIVFVFGETVPKNLFQRHADVLMPKMSVFLAGSAAIFRMAGVVAVLTILTRSANRVFGATKAYRASPPPKRRVASLLQEALVGQTHGEHQSNLIDRVIVLSETPLRGVMLPAHRVVGIASTAGRRELVRAARSVAYARLPVFSERRGQVVGVVKVEELLRADGWTTIAERMNAVTKLSPTTTAAAAISQMRRAGSEMAVVADGGGNMLGIVTLRDLLEEVVGEFG